MSVQSKIKRITVPEIRARKGAEPIVSLTAYHAHTARYLDPYVDFLLVGDSLGMVMYGMETTLGVTLDMMIAHGAAVVRGTERALVVVDMPFGSYEESPEIAFRNACRVIKETGCTAVKLEGGTRIADTIHYLSERGIPVMSHIGLTPQNVQVMGGFKAQGREESEWAAIEADACRPSPTPRLRGRCRGRGRASLPPASPAEIDIPTIGIGASAHCDGQILVLEDMLGLSPKPPKFVREFASLGAQIAGAAEAYGRAVRDRSFPAVEHTYSMKKAK